MNPDDHIDPATWLRAFGLPVRPCGLNADWSVCAWHLGPSATPNMTSGDVYLTYDPIDACGGWYVVTRTYHDDTDDFEEHATDVAIDEAVSVALEILRKTALLR